MPARVVQYIGITGFTSRMAVEFALSQFSHTVPQKLMVGVLASWKSLRGLPMREYWQQQTPRAKDVPELFLNDPRVLNLVHYSADNSAHERSVLWKDLAKIQETAGLNFHGFQLNLAWPPVYVLDEWRAVFGYKHTIVLQVGRDAILAVDGHPRKLAEMLKHYGGVVDYMLFDMSGGEGRTLDVSKALPILDVIHEVAAASATKVSVAGGLEPDTLHLLEPILKRYPDISWDAQKGVRDADNNLDSSRVKKYLERSLAMTSIGRA